MSSLSSPDYCKKNMAASVEGSRSQFKYKVFKYNSRGDIISYSISANRPLSLKSYTLNLQMCTLHKRKLCINVGHTTVGLIKELGTHGQALRPGHKRNIADCRTLQLLALDQEERAQLGPKMLGTHTQV